MLRFNFVLGFLFSTLLFFGGFSNGASNLPKVHQNVSGIEFDVELNEDIIYYSEPGFAQTKISYCRFLDPATNECEAGQISKWADLTTVFGRDAPYVPEFVTKIDMALLNPLKPNDFKVDVLTFGFPTYSMYLNNYPWFKASVFVGDANPDTESTGFSVYLEDSLKYCYNVRPQILVNEEHLNLNLFYNQKELKYLYYFFKKDQYICSLTFKYQEWFKGKAIPQQKYIFPVAHAIIDNFPTVNYAPDFFCIDALYGTFVSLYWNQQSNSLPEAHFYIIDERNLQNLTLMHTIVLTDFDENVLVDIFSKKFDKQFPPTFNSYGRQVFVYFRRPSEDRIFNGLWKNETEYDVHFEPITGTTLRKIWRAKKEYIQIDEPVGKYGEEPSTTTTTIQPSTTTTISSSTTTTIPSSTTTTIPEDSSTTTTTDPSFNETGSNDTSGFIKGIAEPLKDGQCKIYNNLWFIILLICIIVIELIVLVILIIFKFRGAKKMKEEMAKKMKNAAKSKRSIKKKIVKQEKKVSKFKWPTKAAKKSAKEKSEVKSEDTGKSTTMDEKKTTTVDQTTNYYTVNETFDKSTKMKINKK